MTTFAIGRRAEQAAVEFLEKMGYKIVERNWRTRFCEIDIVATHGKVVHFVEVKYRRSSSFGMGLDYITRTKLDQMKFAADYWVTSHSWGGAYTLSAIAVEGLDFTVTDFVEDCT